MLAYLLNFSIPSNRTNGFLISIRLTIGWLLCFLQYKIIIEMKEAILVPEPSLTEPGERGREGERERERERLID